MFERFTTDAIKAIMLAQEESRRLGHNFVGTEQIFLGLIALGPSAVASRVLKSAGITLKTARMEVEKVIGRGSGYVAVEIPFTPRAKRALELSWAAAKQLGHKHIGTEHLLLGLLDEGEGVASRVMETLGVQKTRLRELILTKLGKSFDEYEVPINNGDWSGEDLQTGGLSQVYRAARELIRALLKW